jgi:hypothetical protein
LVVLELRASPQQCRSRGSRGRGENTRPVAPDIALLIAVITGAIRISLVLGAQRGECRMPGGGEAGGGLVRARWLPAQARLLVPAHGTGNCKQSSCCWYQFCFDTIRFATNCFFLNQSTAPDRRGATHRLLLPPPGVRVVRMATDRPLLQLRSWRGGPFRDCPRGSVDQWISGSVVEGAPTEEPRPDASNARRQRPATRATGVSRAFACVLNTRFAI